MTKVIVSYDGTDNDHDALALGRAFARLGADVALAYVRHTRESQDRREQLAQGEAEALLARGAEWLDRPDVTRHVVLSRSTGEGLARLAEQENADIVVLGSEYRTTPGHVAPGNSAQFMLNNEMTAVALAPARLRDRPEVHFRRIAATVADADTSAQTTARAIADLEHGDVVAPQTGSSDLLVIGSKAGGGEGRIRERERRVPHRDVRLPRARHAPREGDPVRRRPVGRVVTGPQEREGVEPD